MSKKAGKTGPGRNLSASSSCKDADLDRPERADAKKRLAALNY
jgi:hypothetical protein